MKSAQEMKIISAQHVLTFAGEALSPGAIVLQGPRILDVGAIDPMKKKYPTAVLEEYPRGTLLPGLVNAHADLSLSLCPTPDALVPRSEGGGPLLMPWLILVSRYKAKLSLDEQQAAVRKGLETCHRSGVTTVGDQCRYPISVSLYEKSPLRVVCLAEIENIQRIQAQGDFEQALALVDEVMHGKNSRVTAGLAPFSAYTLSKNLLRILAHHAIQLKIPLHLHAALSFSEMEFFYDSLGEISAFLFREAGWEEKIPPPHQMTPIQYLHEIGFLKARPALVGCLHLGPTDAALLAQNGCTRVFTPRAFEYLELGEVPWTQLFQEKIPWALGTMSVAAGSNLNLWDEMRAIVYSTSAEDRDGLANWILQAATRGGAEALGLDAEVGTLVPGKLADLLVVDSPKEDDSLAAGLIDQTREESIQAVYVDGKGCSSSKFS